MPGHADGIGPAANGPYRDTVASGTVLIVGGTDQKSLSGTIERFDPTTGQLSHDDFVDFRNFWKEADPDHPILKHAEADDAKQQ